MTEAEWLKQIEADPKDAATKLAYADWLRDRGEDRLANAWEWMARRGKMPARTGLKAAKWWWYGAAMYVHDDPDDLPEEVFAALPTEGTFEKAWGCWVCFDTLGDAVAALAAALGKTAKVAPPSATP